MDYTFGAYVNFFSIGSLIPLTFHGLSAFFFLTIPKKSKSTFHFGMFFLFMFFFNLGYFICGTFYHPLAAYHRWLTVGVILLAVTHYNMSIYLFPPEMNVGKGRIFLIVQYVIALIASFIFFSATINAEKVFHFDGHYWDFNADNISKIIGIMIVVYVVINLPISIFKIIKIKSKERWIYLIILVFFLISTIVPSVLNTLSRDGAVDRQTFQISWDLFNIFGFFLLSLVYMNATKDRISFMGKLIGISLVTFLTAMQFLSYFSLQDLDRSYDEIHKKDLMLALSGEYVPDDLKYLISYNIRKDSFAIVRKAASNIDFKSMKYEFLNTVLLKEISNLPCEEFTERMNAILESSHGFFEGYSAALKEFTATLPENKCSSKNATIEYVDGLKRIIHYRYNKIEKLPSAEFDAAARHFLFRKEGSFRPFQEVLLKKIRQGTHKDNDLKKSILTYLTPLNPMGTRLYRSDVKGQEHFVSFMHVDLEKNVVYEAGFSYTAYRQYIHPTSLKFIIMIFVLLVVIRFGFRFFFSGALLTPLLALLKGVRQVDAGDTNIHIPVKIEDEIGYITQSFNNMVYSINESKHKLQEYAENLEGMVRDRTSELERARDELWGEMQLAKKIQTVLLPSDPLISGFEIAAYMSPADEVGGDYYDIINVDGIDWIVIGDVSGHGIPAGLIMMMVQTAIRTVLVCRPNLKPAVILSKINQVITENVQRLGEDKYMTINVIACIKDGNFFHSGLHQDIMIYRAATCTVDRIETDGMWLGVMHNIRGMNRDSKFKMKIGDVMLLYTDGITESWKKGSVKDHREAETDMFGDDLLLDILNRSGTLSCHEIKSEILRELEEYALSDDVTMIIAKRTW